MLPATQKGFSLIELLIAVVILAIGVIGVMSLLPQSHDYIGGAGRLSVMNHFGQQKLDNLKTRGYDDPDLLAGTHPSPIPEWVTYEDSSGTNIFRTYSITWQVLDNQPQTDMKTIIVTVGHQLYNADGTLISSALNQDSTRFITYVSR